MAAYDPQDGHERHRRTAMRDCDRPEEFGRAGVVIAKALDGGHAVEVSIAPGNGTRYAFLFCPAPPAGWYVSPREGLESAGVKVGGVWVAHLNALGGGSVYPVELLGRDEPPDATYILEKWFPARTQLNDDVFVLERLLYEVGSRTARPA